MSFQRTPAMLFAGLPSGSYRHHPNGWRRSVNDNVESIDVYGTCDSPHREVPCEDIVSFSIYLNSGSVTHCMEILIFASHANSQTNCLLVMQYTSVAGAPNSCLIFTCQLCCSYSQAIAMTTLFRHLS